MRLPRPVPADIVAAVAFLAASEAAVATGSASWRAALALVPVPAAVTLAWRTRMPLEVMIFGGAATAACALAGITGADNLVNALAITLMTYSVGSHEPRTRARVGLAVSFLALVPVAATAPESVGTLVFGGEFFCLAPWALGRAVRRRRELVRELEEKGRELVRRREASARLAVHEERTRVARDLHQVIVRSVAAMAQEAEAGEDAAAVDRERARSSALAIEATGREALGELRGLLGVLRGDEAPALEPMQSPRGHEAVI